MGRLNVLITAPVGIEDLRQTLGTSSADIGMICDEANINPASKRKPIRHANKGYVSDAEMKEANYGLRFNTTSNVRDLEQGYTYVRTTGNDPRRYTDFEGYYHASRFPMHGYGDIELRAIGEGSHSFWFLGLTSIYDLQLEDFPALENFYPCLAIFNTKGSALWKTGSVKFGEQGAKSIDITYNELNKFVYKGPWTYKLCGFSAKQTSLGAEIFGQFTSLPSDEDLTGRITISDSVNIDVKFVYIKDSIQYGENTFEPINRYTELFSIDESKNWRFGVGYNGNIALVARMTNNDHATISLRKGAMVFNVFPTLVESENEVNTVAAQTFLMTMNGLTGQAEAINDNMYLSFKPGETKYIGWNLRYIAATMANGHTASPDLDSKADMLVVLQYYTGTGKIPLGAVVGALRVKAGNTYFDPILPPLKPLLTFKP